MLKLKDVSKFYYNKGVIATGFNKVNIEFKIGEFVAIVGESGSGKSTLLNVISGLDSYEEGEMYINDLETSHYRESDFEEYRKKYVSNIFQNFNLVNSYTVYQNVELVMLLNGYKKKDVKKKILDILDRVGLSKYKNTLTSKLSGGQKQRVAIARALAKETPIIVCDEPTGSLDSKASKEVIKLLKEISEDKLVIVVTHNLNEILELATRIVRMHDGQIISDKKVKNVSDKKEVIVPDNKNIGLLNIIRLGIRNTFNIIPKFVLLFAVFLFITASLLTEYGALKETEYEESKNGSNYFFNDLTDTRIVIKKKDGSIISSEDFLEIGKLSNVKTVVENDILLDQVPWFQTSNGEFYFSGSLRNIDSLDKEVEYGRMPENEDEVVVAMYKDDYFRGEDLIDKTFYLNADRYSLSIKIVGIIYLDSSNYSYGEGIIYSNNSLLDEYMGIVNRNYSSVKININNKNYNSYNYFGDNFSVFASNYVSNGCAYVPEDISYTCKDYNCKNKQIGINVSNIYYDENINLNICNVYNNKNVNNLLGIGKDDQEYGSIYISYDEYNKLFKRDNYQSSVYADDVRNVDMVSMNLEELGYSTLQIRKTLNKEGADLAKIFQIIKLVVVIFLVVSLFFISYFVIKLILKSRNSYFSTLRILGGSLNQVKKITDVELFMDASLAYFSYLVLLILVGKGIVKINHIQEILIYLKLSDYILLYVILIMMSYLLSTRFASKIFKKSAMKSYREEV